ncbi:MAG: 2-oxoacid:acceptor oxidoreductase family protein [Fimbriimonadaceae bacterium]
MSFRFEVRLSGEGGQGLVLAGKVLANAAAIQADLNATQSKSYGPEARGGVSRSEVIVSTDEIHYPKATYVDLLLALTQESYDTYQNDMRPGGIAIVDENVLVGIEESRFAVYQVPLERTALEEHGKKLFTNLVALGSLSTKVEVVTEEHFEAAVRASVPKGTEDVNVAAFRSGRKLMQGREPLRQAVVEHASSERTKQYSEAVREARRESG